MKIGNTDVDITHEDIQACKSVDDLKRLGIFEGTENDFYNKLWEAKQPVADPAKEAHDKRDEAGEFGD